MSREKRGENYFFFAFFAPFFDFFAPFLAPFLAAMVPCPFLSALADLFLLRCAATAGLAFFAGRLLLERAVAAAFAGPPTPLPTCEGVADRVAAVGRGTASR